MSSNTTARPVCFISSGEAADGLITAPSGARLPRRIAIPECGFNGSSKLVMTSWFQQGASVMGALPHQKCSRMLNVEPLPHLKCSLLGWGRRGSDEAGEHGD